MEENKEIDKEFGEIERIMAIISKYGEQYFGRDAWIQIMSGSFDVPAYKQKLADIERLKLHLDTIKTSSLEQYKNLASVSALCATLLVIATFNNLIFPYGIWVQILLTVLLLNIVISAWAFFYNFTHASSTSLSELIDLIRKYEGEEKAQKLEKLKKDSKRKLISYIPIISNVLLTLAVAGILMLVWHIQLT